MNYNNISKCVASETITNIQHKVRSFVLHGFHDPAIYHIT